MNSGSPEGSTAFAACWCRKTRRRRRRRPRSPAVPQNEHAEAKAYKGRKLK